MHLRDQPRDTGTSRRNIPVRRRVVLARTVPVVTDLINQNLVCHLPIITLGQPPRQRGPTRRLATYAVGGHALPALVVRRQ